MRITVTVKLHAKQNSLKKTALDCYEARLAVAPVEGKANKTLVDLIAKELDVAKSRINIVSGLTARRKIFEIM
jgi:uncharacterized protein